ncbi:AbrB/MazE/SpoVT family DNA-binding domain-containing protein [Bacillus haynesii]|uniref:AbrB/MazE/SpoVT family DNA-binding domain-containing protein n=1 Tax=Bacillus haynesii TaxID=1925021 RepID=UPI0022812BE3|nr:AbrB/MazE/SpoVT family DNA-binding domain-containing protein [Bacillus haynesii]MCY8102309.1 AbrB/MazE/SpoVT family DNA-binding domain-containing protein [Bacillus haynesii]
MNAAIKATLSSKGQVTIPKTMRDFLEIETGDSLIFQVDNTESKTVILKKDIQAKEKVDEQTKRQIQQEAREKMFWELVGQCTFTGHIEVKKSRIKDCIEHRRMPKWYIDLVWKACVAQTRESKKKPKIYYILDAFLFDGKRVEMDTNFGDIEEQILFAVVEEVRLKRVNGS